MLNDLELCGWRVWFEFGMVVDCCWCIVVGIMVRVIVLESESESEGDWDCISVFVGMMCNLVYVIEIVELGGVDWDYLKEGGGGGLFGMIFLRKGDMVLVYGSIKLMKFFDGVVWNWCGLSRLRLDEDFENWINRWLFLGVIGGGVLDMGWWWWWWYWWLWFKDLWVFGEWLICFGVFFVCFKVGGCGGLSWVVCCLFCIGFEESWFGFGYCVSWCRGRVG